MTEHPITPPPELVQQWYDNIGPDPGPFESFAIAAARWGADQELEACCEWFAQDWSDTETAAALRATRRPKPPSLKQQALAKLPEHPENMASHLKLTPGEVAAIRRALEALPDD